MPPALKIETGTYSFTDKRLSPDVVEKIIQQVLHTFGIRAQPTVQLTDKPDFLMVNGYGCSFPETLPYEVEAYVRYIENLKGTENHQELYWELLISHILQLQPFVLFPEACLPDYMPVLHSFPQDTHPEIHLHCKEIIQELLQLKIPLVNQSEITAVSQSFLSRPTIDWNDFREELIQSLSSPITICINKDYFNFLTTDAHQENLFELMRDGLFYETGITYPPFKILFEPSLNYNSFYFKINCFTSLPQIGLLRDELLVNETPEQLKLKGIDGRAALNSSIGNPGSIIDSRFKQEAESKGYTTWSGLTYFILSFNIFLRKQGYLCVDKNRTLKHLQTLKRTSPKTCALIEQENLIAVCTKTLRLLAKEEISIRNLPVIFEAILESDYIIADARQYIIFDERVAVQQAPAEWKNKAENRVEFVRTRLKRYISYKYTRGQNTIAVYLLHSEIEKLCDKAANPFQPLDRATILSIQEVVKEAINNQALSYSVPVILTSAVARSTVKKIIELCLPQVVVLSYPELVPETNIQLVARISFS